MKLLSLCSGIGGLDLAVERVLGATTVAQVEYDAACRGVLERHWPTADRTHTDITTAEWTPGEADVLCAGYPCQPFSQAGKRKGKHDERHLWPDVARAVRLVRPRLVILENVAGHLSLGFGDVLADLARLGYDCRWGCVRASDAGMPHRRLRVFIVAADTAEQPTGRHGGAALGPQTANARWGEPYLGHRSSHGASTAPADADLDGPQGVGWEPGHDRDARHDAQPAWGPYAAAVERWERLSGELAPHPLDGKRLNPDFVRWMMGFPSGWVEGMTRTQALKALGNAVAPPQGILALSLLCGLAVTVAGSVDRPLPTPNAADGLGDHATRGGGRSSELLLPGVAKAMAAGRLLPTPRSSDANGAGEHGTGALDLRTAIARTA